LRMALGRAVVICEWIVIGLLALVLATLLLDLPWAWNAQPCSVRPISPDCYPWGAEGPAAGHWRYASKRNYLTSDFYCFGIAALALTSMPWLRPGRRIVALLPAVALFYADEYVLRLIL
jgi:hypothetical protein